MLPPVRTCCSRTCCRLFEHVSAGHVAACSSILQPDMLPTFRACFSRTCCRLLEHVVAGHVAAFSSMLQPDMLPPIGPCCSLIRTYCSQDRIFSSLLVQTSLYAAQAPIDQRHFQVQHRPLYCTHVQMKFRSLRSRKVQEQRSRYVQVQFNPL